MPSVQPIDSLSVADIPALQQADHQVPSPTEAFTDCNARKLSLFLCGQENGSVEWEILEALQRKAHIPESEQERKGKKAE